MQQNHLHNLKLFSLMSTSDIPENLQFSSYVGCYVDTGVRDLPQLAMVVGDLTLERCVSECWKRVSKVIEDRGLRERKGFSLPSCPCDMRFNWNHYWQLPTPVQSLV